MGTVYVVRSVMRFAFVAGALGLLAGSAAREAEAGGSCTGETPILYSFQSFCTEPVWIGQRSTVDPNAYPPSGGSWALAARCEMDGDCPSGSCNQSSGECTCSDSTQCAGAACSDGHCSTTVDFCLPESWNSGTFWPRTKCSLDDTVWPERLDCKTGNCFDGANPLLDCSMANGGGSPTNPVTQFEVTSSAGAVNYDVSIAAGFNVEIAATPAGGGWVQPGTTTTIACLTAGCTGDLNSRCPDALQLVDGDATIGCFDPCTACQATTPATSLECSTTFPSTWTSCSSTMGMPTYEDLYCAANKGAPSGEQYAQASANQGTATSFGQEDCFFGTTFVTPTFMSGYALPQGQGVCLYTNPPQSTIENFNDYLWTATGNVQKGCGGVPPDFANPLPDGTACGGYDSTAGSYPNALGYTCQTATYMVNTGSQMQSQTAHLCMPPTTNGLGVCTESSSGGATLYSGTGGLANAEWITAGLAAGKTTGTPDAPPYYETFKEFCPTAYTWQYDDAASGYACDPAAPGAATYRGFDVTLCSSTVPEPAGGLGWSALAALAVLLGMRRHRDAHELRRHRLGGTARLG